MTNKVYLGEDGIIHLEYIGDQNLETIKEDDKRLQELAGMMSKKIKPINILCDASRIGKQNASARKAAFDVVNNLHYNKIALFGLAPFLKSVTNFVIKASGRFSKVKVFNTEEEAERWLRE